jgi:TonB family protein
MQMFDHRPAIALLGALAAAFAIAGCKSQPMTPAQLERVQSSLDLHLAYARGDCAMVLRETDAGVPVMPDLEEVWPSNRLLRGFCLELDGKVPEARELYRELIVEGSQSFAAADARERLRILDIDESDPTLAQWMRDAKDRVDLSAPSRAPLERVPARYPPLARIAGITGYAVIEFGVTRTGETVEPLIADAQPPFIFDGAALRAVRSWSFAHDYAADPDHSQIVRIVFRLEGTQPEAMADESVQ